MSAYAHIKKAQIVGTLPPAEQQELEDLEALKSRSQTQEDRLNELYEKGFKAHVPPQKDPLFAYAKEVGDRMRARGE